MGGGTRYSIAPPSSSDQRRFNSCLLHRHRHRHRHHSTSPSPSNQIHPFQLLPNVLYRTAGRLRPKKKKKKTISPLHHHHHHHRLTCLLASRPALDESHPPCASGPSSPCHPLHREPCESSKIESFGICTKAGGHRGGPAAATVTHCQAISPTTCSRFFFLLSFSIFPFLPFQVSSEPCAFHSSSRLALCSLSTAIPFLFGFLLAHPLPRPITNSTASHSPPQHCARPFGG